MQKLDLWRWALYTLTGILFILFVLLSLLPAVRIPTEGVQKHLPLLLVSAAFVAYICGMVIWGISLHFSYPFLYAIFRAFQKKAFGTSDYHSYRLEVFRSYVRDIKKERKDAGLKVDDELGRDVPGYQHFILELYRCNESLRGYLAAKLVSSWQSCTLMLAILGSVVLGTIVALAVLLYLIFTARWEYVLLQVAKLLGFVIAYISIGLSYLERNKLLVRDVVFSYILRREISEVEKRMK